LIWETIKNYVTDVVNIIYQDDATMQADQHIQEFYRQLSDKKHAGVVDFPIKPTTKDELIDTLSKIIWQMSAYHSALNFSQV